MIIYRLGSPEVNALMGGYNNPEEDIGLHEPVDPNYEDNTELFMGTIYDLSQQQGFNGQRLHPKEKVGIKIVRKSH